MTSRRWLHLALASAWVVVIGGAVSSCLPESNAPPSENSLGVPIHSRFGDGVERHDLEPLAESFPYLANATAVTWYSGTLYSDRAPGPSAYWIDAVATLPEQDFLQFVAEHEFEVTTVPPAVGDDLISELADGPWGHSETADDDLATADWWATVYVSFETNQVILVAVSS